MSAEIRVERTPATTWSAERAGVSARLPDSGWEIHIRVNGPKDDVRRKRGPEVNWSAIGPRSPADAAAYAEALAKAAEIAGELSPPLEEDDDDGS